MALYRTKPQKVEATQYTGDMNNPFGGDAPGWVWSALASGKLKFNVHGLDIHYSGIIESVLPTDWVVMNSDGIIQACADKIFRTYYTRSRRVNGDETEEQGE